jgi:uncharacterized membrane protein YkvA (DUF1232 family)
MTKRQFKVFLEEADLSPEELGSRLGLSGMTIRRWIAGDLSEELGPLYTAAIRETVLRLVLEGRLEASSKTFKRVLAEYEPLNQSAALRLLGVSPESMLNAKSLGEADQEEQILDSLVQIGSSHERRTHVDENLKEIGAFKNFGREWLRRVQLLKTVIGSRRILSVDKLAAYGALFYLLTSFDLIPDFMPVVGFLDDFAVLGIAAGYYAKNESTKS